MQVILYVFIAIIVGVILFQAVAQQVGSSTSTIAVANESLGTVTNSSTTYLTNYRAISDVVVVNSTNGALLTSSNYTITNNVVYNGALAVQFTATADDGDGFTGAVWNISGTGQPLTYIDDAGGRSMASLVVIFFALAIAVVALYPVYSNRLMELLGK